MEFIWNDVLAEGVALFDGAEPEGDLEGRLLRIFQQDPVQLVSAIRAVGETQEPLVQDPWVTVELHVRAERLTGPGEQLNSRRTQPLPLSARIESAERYVRNVGSEFETEAELLDDLFGHSGRLADLAADQELRARMLNVWRDPSSATAIVDTVFGADIRA
jgi:hypothetical protein